ncbi:hypothetical protein WA158_002415 [Blastocystis sp. Blastoise]
MNSITVSICDTREISYEDIEKTKIVDFFTDKEKSNSTKYVREQDKKTSILSKVLSKLKCSLYLDKKPSEVLFTKSIYGKPYLDETYDICSGNELYNFNYSHHNQYIAFSDTSHFLIGIDILSLITLPRTPIPLFLKTMENTCSETEWNSILLKSDENELYQLKHFYIYWTLKEAYLKAIGTGIATTPLNSIECTIIAQSSSIYISSLSVRGQPLENWIFITYYCDSYICSTALGPYQDSNASIPLFCNNQIITPIPSSIQIYPKTNNSFIITDNQSFSLLFNIDSLHCCEIMDSFVSLC